MNAMDITRDDLVAALTPAPSLEDQLEHAERELAYCPYIESWARCQQETERWSEIVASLKRRIAERDGGA